MKRACAFKRQRLQEVRHYCASRNRPRVDLAAEPRNSFRLRYLIRIIVVDEMKLLRRMRYGEVILQIF